MKNSSQKEHRDLKIEYLDLLKQLRLNRENLISKDEGQIEKLIENAESLFSQIKKPSDLKLDAKISTESAKISSISFEKRCMSDKMSSEKFIEYLIKHKHEKVDVIENYMQYVASKFVGVEFSDHLCINPVVKEANLRQRNNTNIPDSSADFPLRIFSAEDDEGTLTLVKKIKKVVNEKKIIDFYMLVINPKSYSKTIENIFYLSFAIKVGLVGFTTNKGQLCISSEPTNENQDDLSHLIVSLEHGEYKKLIQKLNITDSMLD